MLIRELRNPVTASKADWLPGTAWIGFTPQGDGLDATGKCQATVNRQIGNGYILERVTLSFEEPNADFADDPQVEVEKERHRLLQDRLVAVHKLSPSSLKLVEMIGREEFERLQNIWAKPGRRRRWSVAFPIIETFEIVGHPRAKEVFNARSYKKLYQSQSALLRRLDDEARAAIAELEIRPSEACNAWIAIDNQIRMAETAHIPINFRTEMDRDLIGALEGQTEERQGKLRMRAAWLAHRFAMEQSSNGLFICEECSFNPRTLPDAHVLSMRSCLDVHHRNPLLEGKRLTSFDDLALLCPTCHRIEHLRIEKGRA